MPNEIALTILLAAFTLIFVICVNLIPFGDYSITFISIAATFFAQLVFNPAREDGHLVLGFTIR